MNAKFFFQHNIRRWFEKECERAHKDSSKKNYKNGEKKDNQSARLGDNAEEVKVDIMDSSQNVIDQQVIPHEAIPTPKNKEALQPENYEEQSNLERSSNPRVNLNKRLMI